MKKLFLILLSAISIGIFTGCEDPDLPSPNKPHRENNHIITRFLFDANYCYSHLQYDTLYRIYNQAQMDSLFAGYDFWLPTLDFPNQSMYLYWGWCGGEAREVNVEFTPLNEDLYMLSIDVTDVPVLPAGAPFVVAFYTDLGIEPTDSIMVDVNIHD
ncbi:MAG: hypothetical protein MJZ87_09395 [Bacteroidales bacterium]|nr:hypothetical protein [Bacteroidales bacterium]